MNDIIDPNMPQDERPMVLAEIEATRSRFAEARTNGESIDVTFEVEASVLSLMADMQRQFIAWSDMLAQSQAVMAEQMEEMQSGTQIDAEDADVILAFIEEASKLLKELRPMVSSKHRERIDETLKTGEQAQEIVESAVVGGDDEGEGDESDEEDGEE